MTPEERQLLAGLFDRVKNAAGGERDKEAEEFIASAMKDSPHAGYVLSQAVIVQEEASEEGLQRHYMWPVTLPHHPDVIAYLIPHCNALWWGSKEELLHPEEHAIGAGVCAMRKPRSIELTGT